MSSSPNNNLVAEGDYEASLSAMGTRMAQLSAFVNDISTKELYTKAEESVKQRTHRMINLITDDEYYRQTLHEVNAIHIDEVRDVETHTKPSTKADARHSDFFDEATIIDAEASKRAEELREEIRIASEQLVEIGNGTVKRAQNLAEQEIAITASTVEECASGDIEVEQMFPNEKKPTDEALEKGKDVVSMVNRIQVMTDELRKIDNYLSDNKLSEFTQSVYNIENSTTEAVEAPSKTEKAIVSRENEVPVEAVVDAGEPETSDAPQTRFSYYVAS